MAIHCRHAARCGFCSRTGHKAEDCITKDNTDAHKCANCKGKHAAWHRECPIVMEQRMQAQVAFNNRPARYRVDTSHMLPSLATDTTPCTTQNSNRRSTTITFPDDGPIQQPFGDMNNSITQSSSSEAATRTSPNKDLADSASAQGRQASTKRAKSASTGSSSQTTAAKKRRAGYHYVDDKDAPRTEEMAFAEAIEAAKSPTTPHERSTRRTATPITSSQPSDTCEDTEMTDTTAIPPEDEL